MRFDEHFLRGALSDFTIIKDTFPEDATFCVDTRALVEGDIFIALQGARSDGHDFLAEALHKGAAGFFISIEKKGLLSGLDAKLLDGKLVVAVDNVLEALVACAAAWRSQFDYPVVAITGSVGKTSTRQIVSNILTLNGSSFILSEGNQNTLIGLALNILKMRHDHEFAIFEVGISQRGEMVKLVDMLRPTTALITCIGHCHMEGLGSLSDIAQEKRNVFSFFGEDSIGIVNGDQPILANVGYAHPVIKFGSKTTNQVQARKIRMEDDHVDFVLKIYKEKYNVRINDAHSGSVFNALAATVITHYLGVSNDLIVEGIQAPLIVNSRFESCMLRNNKGVMINDCYNANPESMKAALLALENIETDAKKVAVLGDMLELGVNSPFWHRQLGRFLRKVPSLKEVIFVGDLVEWTKKTVPLGVRAQVVPTWQDAVNMLESSLDDNNVVLVKGSNSMNLNNIVKHFTDTPSTTEMSG